MEQNIDHKIEFKNKLINLYNNNRLKILCFFIIFIIILSLLSYFKINNQNKNSLISEKYIQAGLLLTSKKTDQSINLYDEIILSKNKFYSTLALNIILEKNLISDKDKILNYFKILEEIENSKEKIDLIIFKKALYLIKNNDAKEGKNLLKNLIDNKSKLKFLAEEAIGK